MKTIKCLWAVCAALGLLGGATSGNGATYYLTPCTTNLSTNIALALPVFTSTNWVDATNSQWVKLSGDGFTFSTTLLATSTNGDMVVVVTNVIFEFKLENSSSDWSSYPWTGTGTFPSVIYMTNLITGTHLDSGGPTYNRIVNVVQAETVRGIRYIKLNRVRIVESIDAQADLYSIEIGQFDRP